MPECAKAIQELQLCLSSEENDRSIIHFTRWAFREEDIELARLCYHKMKPNNLYFLKPYHLPFLDKYMGEHFDLQSFENWKLHNSSFESRPGFIKLNDVGIKPNDVEYIALDFVKMKTLLKKLIKNSNPCVIGIDTESRVKLIADNKASISLIQISVRKRGGSHKVYLFHLGDFNHKGQTISKLTVLQIMIRTKLWG